MKTSVILFAVVFFTCIAVSQDQPDSTPMMPRPAFSPEQAKLSFLVGTFTTTVKIPANPMMPNDAMGAGTSTISWGLDSMFLMLNEENSNALFGIYKGHGMLTYNRQIKKYTLSMFNNFGDQPTYLGNFSGDTLVLGGKIPIPNGGSFDQKLLWFKDGNAIRLQVFNNFGDADMLAVDETSTPDEKKK